MDSHPQRDWLYHNVPNWITRSCYPYFVTVCLQERNIEQLIHEDRAKFLYESLEFRIQNGLLFLNLLVVMPDHVHMILHFPEHGGRISKIIGDWKAWTSKSRGIAWQKGFFEHRLRNDREWEEKDAYCRMNPVRAGFCDSPDDWPFTWPKGNSESE